MLKLLLYTRLTNTSKIWALFSVYTGIFGYYLVFLFVPISRNKHLSLTRYVFVNASRLYFFLVFVDIMGQCVQ